MTVLDRRALALGLLALVGLGRRATAAAYSTASPLRVPKFASVYQTAVAISPADNTAIGPYACLYVGGAGNVVICPTNSTTPVTFDNVPAGTFIPVSFQGVNATSTTATDLVGLG